MIDAIYLGVGQSNALDVRRGVASLRNEATQRLASGYKVSRAADDPVRFFQSQFLSQRVGALRDAKSDIGQGISTLEASQVGTQAIEDYGRLLKGLASAAQSADPEQRVVLAAQFDTVRGQIDAIAADVDYQGTNLIDNPADNRDVTISDNPDLTARVEGRASDSASLGLGAAVSYNNFASQADIDAALQDIDAAISNVRSNEAVIASSAAFLTIRQDFAEDLGNTLQEGADKLRLSDVNEDAALLVAADVRDSLSLEGQRIAGQSDRLIADLLSGT